MSKTVLLRGVIVALGLPTARAEAARPRRMIEGTIMKRILALGAALTFGLTAQTALASPVTSISDNFTTGDTPTLNWAGDSVFSSITPPNSVGSPSVDLVGGSLFGNLAPNGSNAPSPLATSNFNAVDLDGTTGSGNLPAGELQSKDSLLLGNYHVSFWLSGNQRDDLTPKITLFSIGGIPLEVLAPSDTQHYTHYVFDFKGVQGQVAFTEFGPSNQVGNLLADVNITQTNGTIAPVPEASTWAMLLLGFVGIGLLSYRGKGWTAFRFA